MKSRLATSIRCSFLRMNLGGRILVSTLVAVIVTAAAGAQSAPAVSSAEARKAIEAGYIEWAKARVALDMNTIERMLAPDFYFQLPDRKLTRQEFIDRMHFLKITRFEASVLTVYVEHYNNVRLNSATGYVTPKDVLAGRQQEIYAERDRKLEAARRQRQSRRQQAA